MVPVVGEHREVETAGGKQYRLQAQQLIDTANKHCLLQEVDQATHSVEILDLIFSKNCDLISSVAVESWDTFTDHSFTLLIAPISSTMSVYQLSWSIFVRLERGTVLWTYIKLLGKKSGKSLVMLTGKIWRKWPSQVQQRF